MTIDTAFTSLITQTTTTYVVSDTYQTPGTFYLLLPNGPTSLTVECWGAGAGGGNTGGSQNAGGGGGAYSRTIHSVAGVAPGTNIAVVVPAAQGIGAASVRASVCNVYYVANNVVITNAQGGANPGAGAANTPGGLAGLAANSTGTTKFDGGAGGAAQGGGGNRAGSGGGGGAGTAGNGGTGGIGSGSGTGGAGGTGGAPLGATGGTGATTSANATAGQSPGGGGGGAASSTGLAATGGSGAVKITYLSPNPGVV